MTVWDARTVLTSAERRREELIALLSDLVSVSSCYGSSAADAQQVVADYLERAAFLVERSKDDPEVYGGHPEYMPPSLQATEPAVNLVARPTRVASVPLALFAHIDTEWPKSGWETSPTRPIIRDGRMYGLGTADDKGGVAAALVAAVGLTEAGRPAPLVMSVHGKGGGARGTLPVFGKAPHLEASLYLHPAETGRGMSEIKNVSRGVLDIQLAIKGWRGPEREVGNPESASFSDGGNAFEACVAAVRQMRETVLGGCEVNLGRIVAGDRPGLVPDWCKAEIRVLFDKPHTIESVTASIRRELENWGGATSGSARDFTLQLTLSGMRANPASTSWEDPTCLTLRQAVTEVTGAHPVPYAGHLASDIRFPIRMQGIPTLGIGSRAGNFYGANEWVDIDDLVRLVAVIMLTVERWIP